MNNVYTGSEIEKAFQDGIRVGDQQARVRFREAIVGRRENLRTLLNLGSDENSIRVIILKAQIAEIDAILRELGLVGEAKR